MFNKKKKEDTFYKDCLKQYEEENKINIKKDHDDIVVLKEKIEKDYRIKIGNNEIDIMAEKIRIERSVGRYHTKLMESTTSLFISLIVSVSGLFIQSLGLFNNIKIKGLSDSVNDSLSNLGRVITFMIIIYFLTKSFIGKDSEKDKINSVVNNIKLKVLEQIEKDSEKENLPAFDEVAVTKERDKSSCSRKKCLLRKKAQIKQ